MTLCKIIFTSDSNGSYFLGIATEIKYKLFLSSECFAICYYVKLCLNIIVICFTWKFSDQFNDDVQLGYSNIFLNNKDSFQFIQVS